MSQFNDPFAGAPYGDSYSQIKKTSGLAVSSLVLSLIGIIPCCGAITAPIGAILGLIGAVVIKPTSAVKGRGLAMAGLLIGLILTAAQIGGGVWIWNTFVVPVMEGPQQALRAGFAGDMTAFKAEFHGGGATAPDAQAQAFIDSLRSRYGEYQSCELDQSQQRQQTFGEPEAVFPYVLSFADKTVRAEALMIFSDKTKGGFIMRWGSITVIDADHGDLTYPTPPPAAAPGSLVPSEGEQPPPATVIDSNGDPGSNGS